MSIRRFLLVVLMSIAVFCGGFLAGAWAYYVFLVDSHTARLGIASESAETTQLLYIYAPPSVARRALERHSQLIREMVADSDDKVERDSYLRELAVNTGRLALLEEREGNIEKSVARWADAMEYLKDSGSTWSKDQLIRCIVGLNELNDTTISEPGVRQAKPGGGGRDDASQR